MNGGHLSKVVQEHTEFLAAAKDWSGVFMTWPTGHALGGPLGQAAWLGRVAGERDDLPCAVAVMACHYGPRYEPALDRHAIG